MAHPESYEDSTSSSPYKGGMRKGEPAGIIHKPTPEEIEEMNQREYADQRPESSDDRMVESPKNVDLITRELCPERRYEN